MKGKYLNWSILALLALIWGSSFILMKFGLRSFTWDEVAAYRIFIAFIFVLPFAHLHLKKELLRHWKGFLGMGMCGNFIPAFLFTRAETSISSALTGMLNSLTPLFTLVLGVLFFSAKTKWINVVGILIAFGGAIALVYAGDTSDIGKNFSFGGFVFAATIFYGLSVNIIKRYLDKVNPVTATVWAMCFIGPLAGIYLFGKTDFIEHIRTQKEAWLSLTATSILGIVGTTLSVIIFNVLIRNTTALFASSVTYMIPIVAIAWGVGFGEPFVFLHITGITLILSGVYLVNKKPA
ncbi:MAG TPA: DMT family transporter [Bacteroidia bacterium]|jgi:drug/metabolite transporter (DMT)-like permease